MTSGAIRVGFIAVGNSVLAIVTRVSKDDDTNGTEVLSILDFETAEKTAIANKSNLALKFNAEFLEALEVLERASSESVSQLFSGNDNEIFTPRRSIRLSPYHSPSTREM